jgi:hypothetical protein
MDLLPLSSKIFPRREAAAAACARVARRSTRLVLLGELSGVAELLGIDPFAVAHRLRGCLSGRRSLCGSACGARLAIR